jgi:hypothetical protein
LDVSTNLTNEGRVTIAIEVIVLDLEVFTQGDQNVTGFGVSGFVLDANHQHGKSDREIEGVECSLVDYNEFVPRHKQMGRGSGYAFNDVTK